MMLIRVRRGQRFSSVFTVQFAHIRPSFARVYYIRVVQHSLLWTCKTDKTAQWQSRALCVSVGRMRSQKQYQHDNSTERGRHKWQTELQAVHSHAHLSQALVIARLGHLMDLLSRKKGTWFTIQSMPASASVCLIKQVTICAPSADAAWKSFAVVPKMQWSCSSNKFFSPPCWITCFFHWFTFMPFYFKGPAVEHVQSVQIEFD